MRENLKNRTKKPKPKKEEPVEEVVSEEEEEEKSTDSLTNLEDSDDDEIFKGVLCSESGRFLTSSVEEEEELIDPIMHEKSSDPMQHVGRDLQAYMDRIKNDGALEDYRSDPSSSSGIFKTSLGQSSQPLNKPSSKLPARIIREAVGMGDGKHGQQLMQAVFDQYGTLRVIDNEVVHNRSSCHPSQEKEQHHVGRKPHPSKKHQHHPSSSSRQSQKKKITLKLLISDLSIFDHPLYSKEDSIGELYLV